MLLLFVNEIGKKLFLKRNIIMHIGIIKLPLSFKQIVCTIANNHIWAFIYFFHDNAPVIYKTSYGFPFLSKSIIVTGIFRRYFENFLFQFTQENCKIRKTRRQLTCGFKGENWCLTKFNSSLIFKMTVCIRLQKSLKPCLKIAGTDMRYLQGERSQEVSSHEKFDMTSRF